MTPALDATLCSVEFEQDCDLCSASGTMTWQQPAPGPDGKIVLTEVSHPCVNGCSGWTKMPAAESGNVITPGSDRTEPGNVARANLDHRTDWSRPAQPSLPDEV